MDMEKTPIDAIRERLIKMQMTQKWASRPLPFPYSIVIDESERKI